MKIDLPRKTKKLYIKRKGKAEYLGLKYLCEILYEQAITPKQKKKAKKMILNHENN